MTRDLWTLSFDGGSIGNPGPSAGAAILVAPDGRVLRASRFLGTATNNQAEYAGLLCGLELAATTGVAHLLVRGDSKLVVCHFTGEWKAKDARLKVSLAEARRLATAFAAVEMTWIPREENAEADAEVRRCLEAHLAKTPAPVADAGPAAPLPERYGSGAFAALNRKAPGQASFQDLAAIKVGGMDGFSRKKHEALVELLGSDAGPALAAIDAALARGKPNIAARLITENRVKLALTALRWVARGLRPEHAGQKVLVDLELRLNATKAAGRGRR